MYRISQIAAKAKGLDDLWGPLFEVVLAILKVDAGTLMILESDCLVRKVARGLGEEIMKEPPIRRAQGGFSWQAAEAKKPVVAETLSPEKIASKAVAAGHFQSLVSIPMIARGQVVGVASVFTKEERHFTEEELNLFAMIANQAATAIVGIQASNLLQQNRRRVAELETLNQLSKSVATLFDFEETLFSTLAIIAKNFNAQTAFLGLFDHQDKLIKTAKPAYGLTDRQINDLRMRSDEGITGRAFCKGVPQMLCRPDDETETVFSRAGIAAKSILAAPLKVKSQTLGVIHIVSDKEDAFGEEDLTFFNLLSSQAAVVVNSAIDFRRVEEERKKDDALLGSIGEGVFAVDKNCRVIMLNRAGEAISEFLAEEVLGKNYGEVLTFFDKTKTPLDTCPLQKVLKSGKKESLSEIYLKKRSGEFFPAEISAAAIYDAEDKVIGSIVVFKDITKEMEVEQLKRELISIATHELRTPITGIKGYLDMVLAGDTGELPEETREVLTEMAAINQRLADLVDDLLNVGRIEDGRIEIRPQTFDLTVLINQTVSELKVQADKKKLQLIFEPKGALKVTADLERTRQVLINLIGNAIKYTPAGSVKVLLKDTGSFAEVRVKDTGIGMDAAQMKRLFEKFYRIKTEQTRQITGTGLGLWITKKLVEMMKGKIWAESEIGKGSVFVFTLPLA